jgi:RNA polymerase sigma-70 factor, ECF subfamily
MDSGKTFNGNEEERLIGNAIRGDLDAFNELVLANQSMAYNHALALLGNPALAEDTTQESFLKAFHALTSFRQGSFRGWLLRIVTNTSYDLLRKTKRHPLQPLFIENEDGEDMETAAWLVDPNASVQHEVEQNEVSKEVYRMVSELPEGYRSVLLLIDLHELDYAEVAQALQIPLGTVKSRLARARMHMREKLKCNPFFSSEVVSLTSLQNKIIGV